MPGQARHDRTVGEAEARNASTSPLKDVIPALSRNRAEQTRMGGSLIDALRGSLRAVERQMDDCRLLAYGVALALIASMSFMGWKYYAGLFPFRGLIAGLVLDLAFAAGFAVTLRRYFQRQLTPRRGELRQQIEELET